MRIYFYLSAENTRRVIVSLFIIGLHSKVWVPDNRSMLTLSLNILSFGEWRSNLPTQRSPLAHTLISLLPLLGSNKKTADGRKTKTIQRQNMLPPHPNPPHHSLDQANFITCSRASWWRMYGRAKEESSEEWMNNNEWKKSQLNSHTHTPIGIFKNEKAGIAATAHTSIRLSLMAATACRRPSERLFQTAASRQHISLKRNIDTKSKSPPCGP